MVKLNTVEIIGAGPAGLYSAILLKSLMPSLRLRVHEQNPADVSYGFGVVFSDQALEFLRADDAQTCDLITPLMQRWQDMTLSLPGETVVLDGIGFSSIGRLQLLQLLQQRALQVGVELHYGSRISKPEQLRADLIIGADGLNSSLRDNNQADFSPTQEYCSNYFAWFGVARPFDTLTQTFVRKGKSVFNAHHYRYSESMSTFIVECDAASYDACGFAQMDEQGSASFCTELFADALDGAPLLTNKSQWRQFPRMRCAHWVAGNRVILGDAAHSAHFSIGSGTRLAFEDAIALVNALREHDQLPAALEYFQQQRQPVASKILDAADSSAHWYDNFRQHLELPAIEFAYQYLTRSGRIDIERLRKLSPGFTERYQRYLQADYPASE